jgi:hypothetical protein
LHKYSEANNSPEIPIINFFKIPNEMTKFYLLILMASLFIIVATRLVPIPNTDKDRALANKELEKAVKILDKTKNALSLTNLETAVREAVNHFPAKMGPLDASGKGLKEIMVWGI